MKVTISIDSTGQIIAVDIPGSLSLDDFKAYLQAETEIEPAQQVLVNDGKSLHENSKTLEELDIHDDDLIVLSKRSARSSVSGAASTSAIGQNPDVDNQIELLRSQALANPQVGNQLRQTQPQLFDALNDPPRFKSLMLEQIQHLQQNGGLGGGMNIQQQEELNRLQQNPDDPASQARILEIIRQEQIQENMNLAYEITPESFASVDMLFINIKVNGERVQAFVDSGAQTTIISPRLAEKVGIDRLIDRRFQGEARGVGSQKIQGKIHSVPISIGDSNVDIPCSFVVIDTDVDLLFGLDMLRRHKCVIDLVRDVLVVGGNIETKFLASSEIENNSLFSGGGKSLGSQLGGNIFSDAPMARPANTTPNNAVTPGKKTASSSAAEAAVKRQNTGSSAATGSSATTGSSGVGSFLGSTSNYTPKEDDIKQLINLGFSRPEAINALESTQGNVEMAASLLFQ